MSYISDAIVFAVYGLLCFVVGGFVGAWFAMRQGWTRPEKKPYPQIVTPP